MTTVNIYNDSSWRPVSLPFPGEGHSVSGPFFIPRAGGYVLEINSPVMIDSKIIAMPPQPPVNCDIHVIIYGESDFMKEYDFKSLEHISRAHSFGVQSNGEDIYESPPIPFPHGGDYSIIIKSNSKVAQFSENGAMISLSRDENPVNWILSQKLFKLIAYILIGISMLGLMISTRHTA